MNAEIQQLFNLEALSTPRRDTSAATARLRATVYHRQWLSLVYGSYLLDTVLLSLYAAIGTTSYLVPMSFFAVATALAASFLVLSELKPLSPRSQHLTLLQLLAHTSVVLVFAEAAPELAIQFWCILFIAYASAALRMSWQEATGSLGLTAIALFVFFVLDNHPITVPSSTYAERGITTLFLMLTLARCVALGLYAKKLRESLYRRSLLLKEAVAKIEELAELDELTGVLNRRSIMQALENEVLRANRTRSPSCIALIDIDWFKNINDKFGHPIGDEVLRTFAINVFANIRNIDKLGRYGGEEFLLILPETPETSAEVLLNRLRVIVSSLDWSDVIPGLSLTFSAGVSLIRPGETVEGVLSRTDIALYDSKQRGRNCVKVAA